MFNCLIMLTRENKTQKDLIKNLKDIPVWWWGISRRQRQTEGQTEWLLYRDEGSFIESGGVAQWVHVCYLNDYACMHAVRITECLTIQYKNNCVQKHAHVYVWLEPGDTGGLNGGRKMSTSQD